MLVEASNAHIRLAPGGAYALAKIPGAALEGYRNSWLPETLVEAESRKPEKSGGKGGRSSNGKSMATARAENIQQKQQVLPSKGLGAAAGVTAGQEG